MTRTARGWRLLKASDGDFDHALGVARMLDGGDVVRLPRPYDHARDERFACSPLDVDESAGLADRPGYPFEREPARRRTGWLAAVVLGVVAWALLVGLAYGVYALLQWVAPT